MKTTDSTISHSTLETLMFLSDEPDNSLFDIIAEAIISYGENALPFLRKKIELTEDSFCHERLESLVCIIERRDVEEKLRVWREKREYDLMEPYFVLSKYRFPNADWTCTGFQMMMLIEQAEREIKKSLTPLEQVKILNHIIYDVNKFRGDTVAINNPNYYYVNNLFEKHIGNPLSLGMLYCIVAERIGIPIYGIDLPNHFILAFCKETERFPQLEDVLFYINPYNKGVVLTRKDIRNYLNEINVCSKLKYFEPTRNSSIVKKLFNTLIETYSMSGKNNEANEMRELMNY